MFRSKDYKQEALKKVHGINAYLRNMRRYQHGITKAHEAMGDLSQELSSLLKLYSERKIDDKEFVKEVKPYEKQLKGLEKAAKREETTAKKERQTIDLLLEKIAAVVLLAIATFSLVNSIVDNPSITGYSVLGISQATNPILILNLLAFVFVLVLIYPNGNMMQPTKVKVSRRSYKKRK